METPIEWESIPLINGVPVINLCDHLSVTFYDSDDFSLDPDRLPRKATVGYDEDRAQISMSVKAAAILRYLWDMSPRDALLVVKKIAALTFDDDVKRLVPFVTVEDVQDGSH